MFKQKVIYRLIPFLFRTSYIYHIDGKIIVKYCIESDKMGRNTRYKSKNSIYKR